MHEELKRGRVIDWEIMFNFVESFGTQKMLKKVCKIKSIQKSNNKSQYRVDNVNTRGGILII